MAFNTFTYAKKYFVSQEIEFVTEPDLEFDETYKIPEDLINLLSDNLIVLDIGAFGNKVGIGTTDITAPRQELDVFGTAIVSEGVGIGIITPRQELDVLGTAIISERVGVGTTAPRQELDVLGTAIISERVGVGSVEPQQKLDVAGSVKIDFNIFDSANSPGKNGYSLFRDARGIRWIPVFSDGAQPGVGFGTILAGLGATPGREGIFVLNDGTPIYSYDDTI
jgi:hypothetical protein